MTVDLHERLSAGLEKLKLVLTDEQQDLLLDYLELLHKWNQHFNLTAVRDIEKMLSVHLFDSLSISRFIKGDTLLDVGTGAGILVEHLVEVAETEEQQGVGGQFRLHLHILLHHGG